QTGVKSFGCENSTAHESPIQSWKRIVPSVDCAVGRAPYRRSAMPSSSSFLLQRGNGLGGRDSRLGGCDELQLGRLELVDVLQDLRQALLEFRAALPGADGVGVLPLPEADEEVVAACGARLRRAASPQAIDPALEVAPLAGEDGGVAEGVGEQRSALNAGEQHEREVAGVSSSQLPELL